MPLFLTSIFLDLPEKWPQDYVSEDPEKHKGFMAKIKDSVSVTSTIVRQLLGHFDTKTAVSLSFTVHKLVEEKKK